MVQELLDLKEKADNIVEKCFDKDQKFVQSLRDAFEVSINRRQNKPAELIGEYVNWGCPEFVVFTELTHDYWLCNLQLNQKIYCKQNSL